MGIDDRDLHRCQRAALEHAAAHARRRKSDAASAIDEVLAMANIPRSAWDDAVAKIQEHAQVALHFHPDRLSGTTETVAESLLASGVYKSQFETQVSNGSVSAFPGGSRHRWEGAMFGGAYDAEDATPAHRPKYGALDLMRHPDGPAPRFGSCYLVLRPDVSRRCTFTYLDSHRDPDEKGTLGELDEVLAALLVETFTRNYGIGETDLSPGRLVERLRSTLATPRAELPERATARNLDHYIEAQVHGDVRLSDDADALVADPAFRSTATGDVLAAIAAGSGIPLSWHPGFVLAAADVPSDFRGASMPALARRIAEDGLVDVRMIGDAARRARTDPALLQELKLLWHVLLRFGRPRAYKELQAFTTR